MKLNFIMFVITINRHSVESRRKQIEKMNVIQQKIEQSRMKTDLI
ncbi:hypothetical protein [Halobacillus litoralis]|nr:hypothetical protein [Halobacillus litoralis]